MTPSKTERLEALEELAVANAEFAVASGLALLEQRVEISDLKLRVSSDRPTGGTESVSLGHAIRDERVIGFHYKDVYGETSYRVVSPWEIEAVRCEVLLLGYDHGRKGIRRYRVDRGRMTSAPVLVPSENYMPPEN